MSRRTRADAALISQWLREQASEAEAERHEPEPARIEFEHQEVPLAA